MVQFLHPFMTTGKNITLLIWTFVGKGVSLLFNMPSTFVIAFIPRSKHLLIYRPKESIGEGKGKPRQYSCLENLMNSMKRQKDRTLKDELPRLVGAQYATEIQCLDAIS